MIKKIYMVTKDHDFPHEMPAPTVNGWSYPQIKDAAVSAAIASDSKVFVSIEHDDGFVQDRVYHKTGFYTTTWEGRFDEEVEL